VHRRIAGRDETPIQGYDPSVPKLACRSCGRQIYATVPVEALFAEERRCTRCGANLNNDRREMDRRTVARRVNPLDEPGPPSAEERRTETRREAAPRRKDGARSSTPAGSGAGWID
jgi:hypothetical protein